MRKIRGDRNSVFVCVYKYSMSGKRRHFNEESTFTLFVVWKMESADDVSPAIINVKKPQEKSGKDFSFSLGRPQNLWLNYGEHYNLNLNDSHRDWGTGKYQNYGWANSFNI